MEGSPTSKQSDAFYEIYVRLDLEFAMESPQRLAAEIDFVSDAVKISGGSVGKIHRYEIRPIVRGNTKGGKGLQTSAYDFLIIYEGAAEIVAKITRGLKLHGSFVIPPFFVRIGKQLPKQS